MHLNPIVGSTLAALVLSSGVWAVPVADPSTWEAPSLEAREPQHHSSQFHAEMHAQNQMQHHTTQNEFAQKMNDAAWKTASHAASDKIQRRNPPKGSSAAQQAMFQAQMRAQNQMQAQTTQEEFAQKMNDAAWKTASKAASSKIQRSLRTRAPPKKAPTASKGSSKSSNAQGFNQMLGQYNQLQQQTMTQNMQMQKAQAFWNPLESMSKKDATS